MKTKPWLAAILLLYLLITVAYGVKNPLFEAPDEQMHYFTVQAIVENRRLPAVGDPPDSWLGQEAAQPPLFYLLGAVLISPIDTAAARQQVWFNPFVRLGDAGSPTNRNAFVHTAQEAVPWSGYVLAAHLLRLFSTLLGAATLLCIYGSGRLVWPEQPDRALAATALVAFLPQFNFLHASISNDPLVVFLTAAALWQLLYLWHRAQSRTRLLLLGLTLGLAVLSKTAGLLLLLFSALWLILLGLRHAGGENPAAQPAIASLRFIMRNLGWTLLPALALSGWLLWRNWALYGDMTAANQFVRLAGGDRNYTLLQVLGETGGLWRSFFAVFGWMNVAPPNWIYLVWNGLALAAVGGALLSLGRRFAARRNRAGHEATVAEQRSLPAALLQASWLPALMLALWTVLVYLGLVQFMLRTPAAQGRLLFPALVPLALGLVYGLGQYRGRFIFPAAILPALLTTLYCLFFVIPQAYVLPWLMTEADLPPDAVRLHVPLSEQLELVAARLETAEAYPGQIIWMTLYWRTNETAADAPVVSLAEDVPEFVIELFGREWDLVGKLQSYHGGGLYPANLWPADVLVADHVGLQMDADMRTPTAVAVQVRVVDGAAPVIAGIIKVAPPERPDASAQPVAQLGETITLLDASFSPTSARPGETVVISTTWRVTGSPGRTLTTFVHLGEVDTPPPASGDAQPLQGFYPTHLWAEGEVIPDSYTLQVPADLAPGRYPLRIGMYDGEGRLPLFVGDERQPGDSYLLGWLTVE